MSKKHQQDVELTPLEKVESLYAELLEWYGEADKKEQRAAAKLLMVALDKFASYEGDSWNELVLEYIAILKNDPEKFQKMLMANRGELKDKPDSNQFH
jgi:hypothetical protein